MKKKLLVVLFLLFAGRMEAQTPPGAYGPSVGAGSGSSTTIVTTNPTTCTTGQVFYNSVTQQAFYCTATNTFSISNGAALPLTFYGAKGDVRNPTGCSITISTAALTCTGGAFTQADVGKFFQYGIANGCAFMAASCSPSITVVTDATHVTLSGVTAGGTITNSNAFILGTDNTAAIRAATAASVAIGLPIEVPAGQYLFGCNATSPIIQPTGNFPGMRGAGNSGQNTITSANLTDLTTRFISCSSMTITNNVGVFFDGINALAGQMFANLGVDGTLSPTDTLQGNGQLSAWYKFYAGQTGQNIVGDGAFFTNAGGAGGVGVQLAQPYSAVNQSFFANSNAVGCYGTASQITFDTNYCGNDNLSMLINASTTSDTATGPINVINSTIDECGYGNSVIGLVTTACFYITGSINVNITNDWIYCYSGTASTTLYALGIDGTSSANMVNSAAGQYLTTSANGCGGIFVAAGGKLSLTNSKYWSSSNRNYINNSGTINDLGNNQCGSLGCGGTYSGNSFSSLSGTFNCINVTPVTTSGGSVTTFQNTLSCTIPANTLNMVGKTLNIEYYGLYTTTAANTSTISLKAQLCSVAGCATGNSATLVNVTSAANAGGVSNFAMSYRGKATTQTAGAALAEESHGLYIVDVGATNVLPDTVYSDTNIATVTGSPSAIDSTAQNFLQISCAFSIANAANTCQGRQLVVESIQ